LQVPQLNVVLFGPISRQRPGSGRRGFMSCWLRSAGGLGRHVVDFSGWFEAELAGSDADAAARTLHALSDWPLAPPRSAVLQCLKRIEEVNCSGEMAMVRPLFCAPASTGLCTWSLVQFALPRRARN